MDELRDQCDAVKAPGDDYYVFSDSGTYGWAVLPWMWSFGGDITDPDITQATDYLNSEATVAAYNFLKKMIDSGCFSDGFIGSGIDTGAGFFGNNTIANILESPWRWVVRTSLCSTALSFYCRRISSKNAGLLC